MLRCHFLYNFVLKSLVDTVSSIYFVLSFVDCVMINIQHGERRHFSWLGFVVNGRPILFWRRSQTCSDLLTSPEIIQKQYKYLRLKKTIHSCKRNNKDLKRDMTGWHQWQCAVYQNTCSLSYWDSPSRYIFHMFWEWSPNDRWHGSLFKSQQ